MKLFVNLTRQSPRRVGQCLLSLGSTVTICIRMTNDLSPLSPASHCDVEGTKESKNQGEKAGQVYFTEVMPCYAAGLCCWRARALLLGHVCLRCWKWRKCFTRKPHFTFFWALSKVLSCVGCGTCFADSFPMWKLDSKRESCVHRFHIIIASGESPSIPFLAFTSVGLMRC